MLLLYIYSYFKNKSMLSFEKVVDKYIHKPFYERKSYSSVSNPSIKIPVDSIKEIMGYIMIIFQARNKKLNENLKSEIIYGFIDSKKFELAYLIMKDMMIINQDEANKLIVFECNCNDYYYRTFIKYKDDKFTHYFESEIIFNKHNDFLKITCYDRPEKNSESTVLL